MSIEVDPDWWKTIFDEVYLLTDSRSVCDEEITRREIDLLRQLLPLRPEDRILDLCGGHGRHTIELMGRGYRRCVLADYSMVLIKKAKDLAAERGIPLCAVSADARATGLAAGSFGHVLILGNSLGYLPDAGGDAAILREARRVLRGGGWIVLDIVDGAALRENFKPRAWHETGDLVVCREREFKDSSVSVRELVLSKQAGLVRDTGYAIRFYDSDTLVSMLEQAGFAQIEIITNFSIFGDSDHGFMNCRMIARA